MADVATLSRSGRSIELCGDTECGERGIGIEWR
jgi:hypothetical protein